MWISPEALLRRALRYVGARIPRLQIMTNKANSDKAYFVLSDGCVRHNAPPLNRFAALCPRGNSSIFLFLKEVFIYAQSDN